MIFALIRICTYTLQSPLQVHNSNNHSDRVNINQRLSTKLLYQVFEKSGELDLLREYNALDIKLYEFALKVADVDKQFYELVGMSW